jgi:hypothetical protein
VLAAWPALIPRTTVSLRSTLQRNGPRAAGFLAIQPTTEAIPGSAAVAGRRASTRRQRQKVRTFWSEQRTANASEAVVASWARLFGPSKARVERSETRETRSHETRETRSHETRSHETRSHETRETTSEARVRTNREHKEQRPVRLSRFARPLGLFFVSLRSTLTAGSDPHFVGSKNTPKLGS